MFWYQNFFSTKNTINPVKKFWEKFFRTFQKYFLRFEKYQSTRPVERDDTIFGTLFLVFVLQSYFRNYQGSSTNLIPKLGLESGIKIVNKKISKFIYLAKSTLVLSKSTKVLLESTKVLFAKLSTGFLVFILWKSIYGTKVLFWYQSTFFFT